MKFILGITTIEVDKIKYTPKNGYLLRDFLKDTYPEFYTTIKDRQVKTSYIDVINYLIDRGHTVETY